ncbi:hypothetical protein ACO1LT_15495, partial [Staphylococcus aureus]
LQLLLGELLSPDGFCSSVVLWQPPPQHSVDCFCFNNAKAGCTERNNTTKAIIDANIFIRSAS